MHLFRNVKTINLKIFPHMMEYTSLTSILERDKALESLWKYDKMNP